MKHYIFIIFICLLSQGCSSTRTNQPVKQPRASTPAVVVQAIEEQPTNVGALGLGLGPQLVNPNDIIFPEDTRLKEPKKELSKKQKKKQKQQKADGEAKNMSDTSDFMLEGKSYWM